MFAQEKNTTSTLVQTSTIHEMLTVRKLGTDYKNRGVLSSYSYWMVHTKNNFGPKLKSAVTCFLSIQVHDTVLEAHKSTY
jgi:hypothetical protein